MLKKLFQTIKSNPFLQDNLILFIGLFVAGIGGFIYHFVLGRLLGPADYGSLGALLSLAYIFLIILNTTQMGIADITTRLTLEKADKKITYLFRRLLKELVVIGIIFVAVFLALSSLISGYLHVPYMSVFIVSFALLFIFLLSLPRGMMQGLQRFTLLSSNNILESFIKLFAAILFVILGYGVAGAIGGIVFGYALAFVVGMYHFRSLFKTKEQTIPFNVKPVYSSSLYLGFVLIFLTLYYTMDVLLVKHFFDATQAGYYAALAILGKVIFFGTSSIGQVMFPKVIALHAQKKPHKHLFYKSCLLALLFIFPVLFFYFVFPTFVVTLLFGSQFLEIVPLLGLFGIYMTLFCLIYLFSYYFVSLGKNWIFLLLLFFFNILEIYLLYEFHESLAQVITLLISLSLIFLMILYVKFMRTKDA
ncbi:oligosaccharide flippase family protein [Candidatus Woesearchaeota archaeon]|nr:oligosaccharide flippase family protein [Candidatus Woesearchaeota archaeon]